MTAVHERPVYALSTRPAVPGSYEAPATSAYLYYTAEDKAWAPSVKVTVDR